MTGLRNEVFSLQIKGISSELEKLWSVLTGKYLLGLLKCKSLIDPSQTQAMCVLSRRRVSQSEENNSVYLRGEFQIPFGCHSES